MQAIFRPVTGVACGNRHNGITLHQIFHDALVSGAAAEAGVAGTKRQIDGIRAENNRILDGDHIIGVIGATVDAEHLHGKNLRVRGDALGIDLLQRRRKSAVAIGNIAVGGGNARHMGAMLALGIGIVGGIQIFIHIVKSKRQFIIQK